MAKQLFRKVSLERLSSPEQLDLLMQVTTPKGWLALLALGALLTVAIIWGILGSIPEKVSGWGVFIKRGGVLEIVALKPGQIKEMYFDVGDIVQEGQIVARIARTELLDKIKQTKEKLTDLHTDYENYADFSAKNVLMQMAYQKKQRQNLEQTNRYIEKRLKALKERKVNQIKLLKKGLITQNTILNTQQEIDNAQEEIDRNRGEFEHLSARELELKNEQRQGLSTKKQAMNATKRDLQTLQIQWDQSSRVFSPYTGRILEIQQVEGALINAGEPILMLESIDQSQYLEAVIFIPFGQGKKVDIGMKAHISPSTVKQEEFGFVLGLVTYVSQFPTTSQGMLHILENEALVQSLAQSGPSIELRVALLPDPNTASGFKWSSSKGPPVTVDSGTLCFSSITVREQAPINMVIPFFKKHLLGVGEQEFTAD